MRNKFYCLLLLISLSPVCVAAPGPHSERDLGIKENQLRKQDVEDIVDKAIEKNLKPLVEKEVFAKEEERFKQLSWIIALFGLIGVGTFGTLAKYLIESAVEQKLERRTGEISSALDFSRFYALTLKLAIGKGFTPEDVDAIMNYLRKVERNSQTRHSSEFISALFQVMKSFTSASQSPSIDELFVAYEQEILSAPALVQPLLHHYGQDLVGRDITPKDDISYRAFERLERVATSSRVPELALAYRTLYESKKNAPESGRLVNNLLVSSTKLSSEDRARYLHEILLRTRSSNWMRRETKEGFLIQLHAREFVKRYKKELLDVYGLEDRLAQDIAVNGIDDQDSEKLAASLSENVSS